MGITFRKETFRDDFTFRNSPEHIRRFPFPFHEDDYMYAVNIEPHVVGPKGSVLRKPDRRRRALCRGDAGPGAGAGRGSAALPVAAAHDAGRLGPARTSDGAAGARLSRAFHADPRRRRWRWINRPLGIDDTFTFGDTSTLPYGPMEYITRQSQGDFCILDQRDGNLWMDAGMVTTQADWSLDFDIGMNFFEWHAPVPLAHEKGIFDTRAEIPHQLQQGKPARRLNWTMTINPRLDTSPENYHKWGPDRTTVTPENVGDKVHLRVELQSFWRLPRSNGIVFPIRCYLIKMDELVTSAEMGAPPSPRAPRPARRTGRLQGADPLSPDSCLSGCRSYDDGSADLAGLSGRTEYPELGQSRLPRCPADSR